MGQVGLGPGSDIDIITGKPLERMNKDTETGKITEDKLRDQASLLGISQSEDGKKLIETVAELLEGRINILIIKDPEASAYLNILKSIGLKESMARKAVERLSGMMKLKKE